MTAPSSFKIALACGAGGTYVDVTSDVLFEEGTIPIADGRTSQFDPFAPGTFPFTLANGTGKYSPDNPASTLAVSLAEGMGVSIELDGLLFSGTVRALSLSFPTKGLPSTARVRVVCDDMLGNAGRHGLGELSLDMWSARGGLLRWSLADPAGVSGASEQNNLLPLNVTDTGVTFGVTATNIPVSPVVEIVPGSFSNALVSPNFGGTFTYGTATIGALNLWVETTATTTCTVAWRNQSGCAVTLAISGGQFIMTADGGSTLSTGLFATPGRPYAVSITTATTFAAGVWTTVYTLWIDGVSYGTSTSTTTPATLDNAARSIRTVAIGCTVGGVRYAHLTHTLTRLDETPIGPTSVALRLAAIASTTPEITLDTLPTLSTATLGKAEGSGGSTLDALNEVIRAEQAFMWAETTGSLLSPVQKIKVAPRDRGRAVDYTFDVSEIQDPIAFVRSLTNTISEFTATGTDLAVTYENPNLVPIVGSASSSDSVPLRDASDLLAYASDRMYRGINQGIPIAAVTIDATSPLISRWTALSAIRLGYRLHITGLPVDQLGYSTWDGIVVGRPILNTQDTATDEPKTFFTYYLAPWPAVSKYGTGKYGSGGGHTLQTTINSSATSLGIVSTGALWSTDVAVYPMNVLIDDEIITLSGVTGASSPQTGAISARGVGIGHAASHTSGVGLEPDPAARFDL